MSTHRPLSVDHIACGGRPWDWVAADGSIFPGLAWDPADSTPVANVLCIHGLSGSAADFGPVAQALIKQGYAVRAINVRGQGNDPEKSRRGHFLNPQQWRRDLAACATAIGNDKPFYVIGESMGSLIAIDAVANGALTPERLVLAVPVPVLRTPIPKWIIMLMHHVARIVPKASLSPFRFVNSKGPMPRLTADDVYMEYLRSAPHRVTNFTIGFLSNFQKFMFDCQQNAQHVQPPTLMLAGGKDIFISSEQSKNFFETLGAKEKEYSHFPESHHLLWHDIDKNEVINKITTWISKPPAL